MLVPIGIGTHTEIRMKKALNKWWEGTYVPPPKNDPNSSLFFIGPGTYELHWTSKAAHAVKHFWVNYWQWCFSAAFATIGLIIAGMKL